MKTIELNVYGIVLTVDTDNPGASTIESDIKRTGCVYCEEAACCFSCDESKAGGFSEETKELQNEDDVAIRFEYNGALAGIEAMILAHACAGIDVTTPAYLEGIETALEKVGFNL